MMASFLQLLIYIIPIILSNGNEKYKLYDYANTIFCQLPRPVKGSGLAKGSCPIQFQRFAARSCGPSVSLPHYGLASIPRYRGRRLHRRAIDEARLYI